MRGLLFVSLSVVWVVIGGLIWFSIKLSCGMGPDSPLACNMNADYQASLFLVFLLVGYGLFSLMYWSRRFRKER
jgi:hypothetical protein